MDRRTTLNVIEVREPCQADWNAMAGNDRARFCSHCSKLVHNLSAMLTDEAERLICESGGNLCLRFAVAPDGSPMPLDYQQKSRRRGWKFWTMVGVIGALLAAGTDALLRRPPAKPPVQYFTLGGSI